MAAHRYIDRICALAAALSLAAAHPQDLVIFIGVGFETTAPATAATILTAEQGGIDNFAVCPCHKLVPPALAALLAAGLELGSILPQALIFITLLTRMLPVSKRIVEALTGLRFASRYFEALRGSLLRYGALRRAQADRTPLREKPVTLESGIRVEGLCFRYPNGKQIFENASIHIPAGRSTAVIGPSGGGKTTLLDLLLGLLRPQGGHIWYDDFDLVEGRDGQGPCRGDVGAVVSYIPQTVFLNDETVRGNVAFMAAEEDEERIIRCLECAQIW